MQPTPLNPTLNFLLSHEPCALSQPSYTSHILLTCAPQELLILATSPRFSFTPAKTLPPAALTPSITTSLGPRFPLQLPQDLYSLPKSSIWKSVIYILD